MSVYSLADVHAAIVGPGGAFPLSGEGAGIADEGVTITMANDLNTMTTGADEGYMHSLRANKSGTVTVRLLKTSTVNAQLMAMATFQRSSSSNHGRNVITLRDVVRGDVITCRGVAFGRIPDLTYAAEGGTIEWRFDAGKIDGLLGFGSPERA